MRKLSEIWEEVEPDNGEEAEANWVIKDLKELARDWIKELEEGTHPLLTLFTDSQCEAIINFLKYFILDDESVIGGRRLKRKEIPLVNKSLIQDWDNEEDRCWNEY